MLGQSPRRQLANYRTILLALCLSASLFGLAGCRYAVTVRQPQQNISYPDPVSVDLELHPQVRPNTFSASMDGNDVTGLFMFAGPQGNATINLPPGAHTLHVEAAMYRSAWTIDQRRREVHFRIQQPPPPPPPPPGPSIGLNLSSSNLAIVWGQSDSVTVTVQGRNGFAGGVDLELQNAPPGVTHSFSTPTVVVPANGTAPSTLTLTTAAAATGLAPPPLRVRAVPQNAAVNARAANLNLGVRRTPGAFTEVALRATDAPPCTSPSGDVVNAIVVAAGGPAVQITGQPFSQTNPQAIPFSTGYAISPKCRVALIIPPVVQNIHRTTLWNLAFDPAIGASPRGRLSENIDGAFTNGFFSPDDSLFVLVTPGGPGTTQTAAAGLWDMARGVKIGSSKFFTAQIQSVVLSGDQVTLNTNPPLSQPSWIVP